jgi:hypothetical protein
VLVLLCEIDTTVAAWEHGKKTIDRLHQLAARDWRPMDCALMAVRPPRYVGRDGGRAARGAPVGGAGGAVSAL